MKSYRNEKHILIAICVLLLGISYISVLLSYLGDKGIIASIVLLYYRKLVVVGIPVIYETYMLYRGVTTKQLEIISFYPLKAKYIYLNILVEVLLLLLMVNGCLTAVAWNSWSENSFFEDMIASALSGTIVIYVIYFILLFPSTMDGYTLELRKVLYIIWAAVCIKVGFFISTENLNRILLLIGCAILLLINMLVIGRKGNEGLQRICSAQRIEHSRYRIRASHSKLFSLISCSLHRINRIYHEIGVLYLKSIADIIILFIIYSKYQFFAKQIWIDFLIVFNIVISTISYKIFSMDRDYVLVKDYYPFDKREVLRKYCVVLAIQIPYVIISNTLITFIYHVTFGVERCIEIVCVFLLINFLGVLIDYLNTDMRVEIKDTDRGEMNKIILLIIIGFLCAVYGVL